MLKRPRALSVTIVRACLSAPPRPPHARPDPSSAVHRLRNLDTAYREEPHEPKDDGEGPGHILPPKEEAGHGVAALRGAPTPDGLEKVKEAKAKDHGRKAVYLTDRDGEYCLCPHCGKRMDERSTYTDAKGWTFHRPCMAAGAVKMREKQASDVFDVDYMLPPDQAQFDVAAVKRAAAPPPVLQKPVSGGWIQGMFSRKPAVGPDGNPLPPPPAGGGMMGALGLSPDKLLQGFMPSDEEKVKLREELIEAAKNEVKGELHNVTGHVGAAIRDRFDQVNTGVDTALTGVRDGLTAGAQAVTTGLNAVGQGIAKTRMPGDLQQHVPADWRTPVGLAAGAAATGLGGYGLYRYMAGRKREKEKEAQYRPRGYSVNAPTPAAGERRDRATFFAAGGGNNQPPDNLGVDPNVALPLLGAGGGALTGGHTPHGRLVGALRGLAAGGGAALGQHVAGAYTGGDVGARLAAGAGGGALAYLLARSVTPENEEDD